MEFFDEAGEINQSVWEMIPLPAPLERLITIPEGYVFVDDSRIGQSISIGANCRGLVMRLNDGPGPKQWIRGYRDDYDLNKFYHMMDRPVNAPDKLEGRRKIDYVETDSHFITGGPLHFFDPDERPTD